MGKVKTVDFSETIVASDLKVGRCRQLIEFMKLCEYRRSRSFLYHIYSPALKKWGLYWICPVCPSVILSFCNSVIIFVSSQYLENQWTEFNQILYTH